MFIPEQEGRGLARARFCARGSRCKLDHQRRAYGDKRGWDRLRPVGGRPPIVQCSRRVSVNSASPSRRAGSARGETRSSVSDFSLALARRTER